MNDFVLPKLSDDRKFKLGVWFHDVYKKQQAVKMKLYKRKMRKKNHLKTVSYSSKAD